MCTQALITSVPTDVSLRADLVKGLWQHEQKYLEVPPEELETWNAYFAYYETECMIASHDGGRHLTIRTHEDIIQVAQELKRGCTKRALKQSLSALDTQKRQQDVMEQMAEGSIRLAVRLFAMVDVGSIYQYHISVPTSLRWSNEQQDLKTLLGGHFRKCLATAESSKFGRGFNALNIQRYTGLRIKWTNNIVDHLRLVDDDTAFCIFHHVTWLRNQDKDSSVFPAGFLDETLRTLELLFPCYDIPTRKWLEREAKALKGATHLDMGLAHLDRLAPHCRRVSEFEFWHDRLFELKERFEQPGHTSFSQLWYDRRNGIQWILFWFGLVVAFATLFTFFLTIFQTGLGAVQVYKAYHPS